MNGINKPELIQRLACPKCGGTYTYVTAYALTCSGCGQKVRLHHDKPVFTRIPPGMQAAPKIVRSPEEGSPWRRANWRFLEDTLKSLPKKAVILDFGAGHGDFSEVLGQCTTIALDVYPYEEVDVVCNLEEITPFIKSSFDAIVLMNVLEHISQPDELIQILATLLRPSGLLIITVPFMLKLHQQPYDYNRYSHYQLAKMGQNAKLKIVKIEAYYDPVLLFKESINNARCFVLPNLSSLRRKTGRILLEILAAIISGMERLFGPGFVRNPKDGQSPYPIGYHVIYRENSGKHKN